MENQLRVSVCPVCFVSCNLSCGSCNKVHYCSKKHQKEHWKIHKSYCFPAAISQNSTVGRHLIATRDILQGEIILQEKPILSGPSCTEGSFPVCLGCYRIAKSGYECSKCQWPMCDFKCEQESVHADFECPIFAAKVPPYDYNGCMADNIYDNIKVLRCLLLRDTNPVLWEIINRLESHVQARKHCKRAVDLSNSAFVFVRKVCKLTRFERKTIDYISGILGINCFGSDERHAVNPRFRAASYLYHYGSMTAHDCRPNSFWCIQLDSQLILRALVPIKKNEAITQLYVQSTLGTPERRKLLKDGHYFLCACRRCTSPTELDSFFSAVKCPNCSTGYLLSEQPLNDIANWKCDNLACLTIRPQSFIEQTVTKVKAEQDAVDYNDSVENIEKLEKILAKHQKITLHSQHYLMHGIEYDILQRISYALITNMNLGKKEEKFERRQAQLCKKCLIMSEIIWPGHNRHRGRLLYFLQQALLMIVTRNLNNNNLSLSKSNELHDEIDSIRKQGREILSIEPEGRDEYTMCQSMSTDIRQKGLL